MKLLHLADLHIGKRLHEYSLLDDQRSVLVQAAELARTEGCEAVLIAGDIYDRSAPSVEAMTLFDSFLTMLCRSGIRVYMISGNHDAAGRISYFSDLLGHSGVHTSAAFGGKLQRFSLNDGIGVHLLPFIRPLDVRKFYPGEPIVTYEDAVRVVLSNSEVDAEQVNILLCHQFITGCQTCDSEEFAIGGLDNIGAEVFDGFDYVALGHLHQAQSCGRETVRYAGSPLKYSVSEEHQRKSFTILEVKGKGRISIRQIPVKLPHEVRTVRGSFADLMNAAYTEDYVRVILNDENVPPDAVISLRSVFSNMLKFSVENSKTKYEINVAAQERIEDKTPMELFADFFAFQNNGAEPTAEQWKLAADIFTELEAEQA